MTDRSSPKPRKMLFGLCAGAVIVVALAAGLMFNQSSSAIPAYNQDTDHVAIKGYDTVAYFTENKAIKGSSQFTSQWEDTAWHFASAANRDLFDANQKRYAPQFGGYCALGISAGEYADIDPEAFTIVDGKLYFNYNKEFRDNVWKKAPDAYLVTAGYNWENNRDKLRDNR